MRRLLSIHTFKYLIAASGFLVLFAVGYDDADGKTKKRSKRYKNKSHSHSHSHGHSHEEPSPWIFGAGVSLSSGIGGDGGGDEGGEGGDHTGHNHLTEPSYSLGEGHDHDAGGEDGGSAAVEPSISGLVGYRIAKNTALNLELSLGISSGLGDPIVGAEFAMAKIGKIASTVIPSVTLPVSKASSDSYKLTTLSVSWNPSLRQKKLLYSGTVAVAKSYYSKTVIVEEESARLKAPTNLALQEDHDHEHEGEIEESGESLGTGDREFDRYSVSGNATYRISKSILAGGGLGLAFVTKQFGSSAIETNLTLAKGTYLWKSIATSLSFGLSESAESFAVPQNPFVSMALFYTYE